MKIRIDDLKGTYESCSRKGNIKEKTQDIELIKSLKLVAEKGLEFINSKSKGTPKDSTGWTFVFRDYYESLRGLIEAFLLFDGIEADNHQCKNACICFKYPELELTWEFLETIRLRRNAINYKGLLLNYEDWALFKVNFDLHISALTKAIEQRLNNPDSEFLRKIQRPKMKELWDNNHDCVWDSSGNTKKRTKIN